MKKAVCFNGFNLHCFIACFLTLSFTLITAQDALAQRPVPGGQVPTKRLDSKSELSLTSDLAGNAEVSPLQDIIQNSVQDPNQFDAATRSSMQALQDVVRPPWEPNYHDDSRADRAVQRAFTIQGARHGSALIKRSDLQSTYRSIKQSFKDFQDTFRYSLQSDPDGLVVTRESKGEKLLELNMEVNASQGLDPQIKIGEYMRFRYDFVDQHAVLETGFQF